MSTQFEIINFTFMKLYGPFKQIVTLEELPLRGAIDDSKLVIHEDSGVLVHEGIIKAVGSYEALKEEAEEFEEFEGDYVLFPGFVDCHTHICFAGNRANDFAMRNAGKSYLDIAAAGGGIWSSVEHTRAATEEVLLDSLLERIDYMVRLGITTIEIKSGYGLSERQELKMLRVIQKAQEKTSATLVPTCLAAHMKPKDFEEDPSQGRTYLNYVLQEVLTEVKEENLARRVDIFIEKSAFQPEESQIFLEKAKILGFDLTVHADQFTPGSSRVAVDAGARSADHLEVTAGSDLKYLAESDTVAVALPGASIGLGEPFAPARELLDHGAILAIGSDWNPGSAPMGNLITQASILATYQKLSTAEVLSGITYRAAHALNFEDRGRVSEGMKADFVVYSTDNYQNLLYKQGALVPDQVFINGEKYNGRV